MSISIVANVLNMVSSRHPKLAMENKCLIGYSLYFVLATVFNIMDLDKMQLPKINERKQQSKILQTSLKLELMKTIERFEKENDYQFESYEVDNILLEIIKRNHESYLNTKFGYDRV